MGHHHSVRREEAKRALAETAGGGGAASTSTSGSPMLSLSHELPGMPNALGRPPPALRLVGVSVCIGSQVGWFVVWHRPLGLVGVSVGIGPQVLLTIDGSVCGWRFNGTKAGAERRLYV